MFHFLHIISRLQTIWLIIFTVVLTVACAKKSDVLASNHAVNSSPNQTKTQPADQVKSSTNQTETPEKIDEPIDQTNPLTKLLAEANFQAVEEAKRQGKAALPIIRPFLKDKNFQVRQIAVSSAGAVGDPQAADILAAGLGDENINVRLAAARELSKKAYPLATESVLAVLKKSPDETVRELLAEAAGFLSGKETVAALRPLANGDSVLAEKAIFALAKLGDGMGRKVLSSKLLAKLPRTRYEALEALCYVNNPVFATQAKKLLSDKATGLQIGSTRNPRNRRVADQAVDSLVCLLKLKTPFETSPEKIYTDPEIATIRNLVK